MPAYNFKKEFAPLVESGQKRQTIRQRRKRPTKVGDTLYLYTGMRTRDCRKLRETICINVKRIKITNNGVNLGNQYLYISHKEEDELAKADGFESYSAFKYFFETHYSLPFIGVLIQW